ncbi:MAG: PBECR2 nuclease fold domain-containing protein [Pseudomonadota bacterium]
MPTLTEQFEVRATAYDNSIWRRYIGLFTGRTDLLAVVRLNRDGSLFWNYMQANSKSLDRTRIGGLIYER